MEKLRSAFCIRLKWCKRNCSAVERGLALCCCCYLSFSPNVHRVRRMCHAFVCVCSVHPLLCVLKSCTKYCGPFSQLHSQSSSCLSSSTFHYVLLCSFSKFQWLWLRLWLGLLSVSGLVSLFPSLSACVSMSLPLSVCAVCVRVLVSSTIELIDV